MYLAMAALLAAFFALFAAFVVFCDRTIAPRKETQ